jgi:hypothetical protein
MKVTLPILKLFLVLMGVQSAFAQAGPQGPGKTGNPSPEQEVITLSKDKWQWMAAGTPTCAQVGAATLV